MDTPLASKTTVSSRNKMAAGLHNNNNNNNNNIHRSTTASAAKAATTTTTTSSKLPPKTVFKPPLIKADRTATTLAATYSRIALPRSRLSGNTSAAAASPQPVAMTTSKVYPTTNSRLLTNSRFMTPALAGRTTATSTSPSKGPSFANSRSSSKLSSVSSSVNNDHKLSSRQSSMSNAQVTARNPHMTNGAIAPSNYVPDTNVIRKGLAKFSNPIECQRQFQALNSKLRELNHINENKEKTITRLQDQLKDALERGVGYAIIVQYFSKKLKIHSTPDLENECQLLKSRVDQLMVNEREHEQRLDSIIGDYKNHLQVEQDLKAAVERELEATKVNHSDELVRLKEAHRNELQDLEETHSCIIEELKSRIQLLETDLNTRTRELAELRKEYDHMNASFNKLEESLTRDKDARVKYAQEKVNQLQKDVESLNSVLEMRTERIHELERDSILLGEVQQELMKIEDNNKALRQQLESLTAALENKRVQYENILADHEKIVQELKRERRERRRMTMRTEQLEYVLNESCVSENNVTVLDSSVET